MKNDPALLEAAVTDLDLLTDEFLEDERRLIAFLEANLTPLGFTKDQINSEMRCCRDLRAKVFLRKDEMKDEMNAPTMAVAEYVTMVECSIMMEEVRDKNRKCHDGRSSRINAEMLRYQTNKFKELMKISDVVAEDKKHTPENRKRKSCDE